MQMTWNYNAIADSLPGISPEPGFEPPINDPEPAPTPVVEPDYPDDPGPAEDPERQPVVD